MKPVVSQTFRIESYETDIKRRLKPLFVQNHLQEMAYQGSEYCGASYEVLRKEGLFWALNRMHFRVYEMPLWGDHVRIDTWSRGQMGPLWHRNLRIFRGEELCIEATSAWTILSLDGRGIYRGDCGFDPNLHYSEDTLPFCTKIIVPADLQMQPAGSHTVVYSDLDSNQHANNCMYTQWAVDALPLDYVRGHDLYDFQVCYYHEIRPGETVEFKLGRENAESGLEGGISRRAEGGSDATDERHPKAQNEPKGNLPLKGGRGVENIYNQVDTWYLLGYVSNTQCFVVRMEFK